MKPVNERKRHKEGGVSYQGFLRSLSPPPPPRSAGVEDADKQAEPAGAAGARWLPERAR